MKPSSAAAVYSIMSNIREKLQLSIMEAAVAAFSCKSSLYELIPYKTAAHTSGTGDTDGPAPGTSRNTGTGGGQNPRTGRRSSPRKFRLLSHRIFH